MYIDVKVRTEEGYGNPLKIDASLIHNSLP